MKKLFTILCAAVLSLGVSAQTESGNMMVGVNSNFNFSSFSPDGGGDSESSMHLGGQYGYFFMDNLAGVVGLDYSKSGDADAVTAFGIGARYYINSLYIKAGYQSGFTGEAAMIMAMFGGDPSKGSVIQVGAGYVHMLTDNISLEPSLSYDMMSYDGETFGSNIGLNIAFGLYF